MRYWLFIVYLAAVSCAGNGPQKYTIKGVLPDERYDNTYLYVEKHDILPSQHPELLDSVPIVNGTFTVQGTTPEMPVVFHLVIPVAVGAHHTLPVIVDQNTVEVTYDDKAASLKGGKTARRYNDLILAARRGIEIKKDAIVHQRAEKERGGGISVAQMEDFNTRIREVYMELMPAHTQFVRENIGNPLGWSFFFSVSLDRYDGNDREELYSAIPETLRAKYEETEQIRTDKQNYFQQSQKAMAEGAAARDITGFDVSGNSISLSDFRGKAVLVDIWASWCRPCIHEFPEIKKIYAEYKDRGLEIIGFSLDESEEAWKKAIGEHELPWINISDLKAWESPLVADYGIQAISFTILIDHEGRIAGRNLHAHNLTAALEKLFAENLPTKN